MACRIGPFAGHFYKEIHKLGGTVYLNPDGHEWMRAKWSAPIRKYWKISEQMMVKYCDLAICDSVNIGKYIHECYDGKGIKGKNPKTTFIAYGADLTLSKLADDDEKLVNWYKEKGLTKKGYYLVVGRFVPENSFEVMIREFMKSKSQKDFAIITNINDKFLNELEEKLHFKRDKRIKFVGTVYDQELLKKIRENAYAYFHGHTVGGTNPSLIEALGSTDLNLLVDVGFNKEVAEDCALYWSRKPGRLAKLIDKADQMGTDEIAEMGRRAKQRVAKEYTFYLSYVIVYISLFIGDVYNGGSLDAFARYLRICSYVLIFTSCINLKLKKKEIFQMIAVLMVTLLYAVKTGDLYWSILILLIYNSKRAKIENIYKMSLRIIVLGIISVLVLCVVGVLPDVLTSRNTVEQINYNRHSLGFYHSNVLPLLIFYLEVYYICITKERARNKVIVFFMSIAIVVNFFCHSRNALILSVSLSMFIFIAKKKKKHAYRALYRATIFSIPCMSIFSFAMMFLLLKGGIWNTIDSFFSGRFRLAIFKMRRIGIHLINIMSNEFFSRDNIVYVNGQDISTIALDSGAIILRNRD